MAQFITRSSPDKGWTPGFSYPETGFKSELSEPRPLQWSDLLQDGDEVRRFKVSHLSERFPDNDKQIDTPLKELHPDATFLGKNCWTTQACYQWGDPMDKPRTFFQMLHAGQREKLYWNPAELNAAIVNCGGLCPGLNAVIREVTLMLRLYGVKKVFGIIGGFKGVMEPENWIELSEANVDDIHLKGGSFLVSDRGNPKHYQMAEMMRTHNIRHLYIIGGDGTHKGATTIYEEASAIPGVDTIPGKALDPPYEISVVGIPKTIDNDIAMMDFTFGFHSAVAEAVRAIDAAYVESSGNANCLGLVKLMGRSSGFIAMNATLAAGHVDLCLIPEMNIDMNKVLDYIVELQTTKHNAVVVIAEGLGDTLIKGEGVDAGGNKKLADVGPWFKEQVEARFKEKQIPLSIKYIDPSYQVRAVPPDAFDSVYCAILAQNAVHAAMAGYTGFTVGRVDENYVVLPIQAITEQPSKTVGVKGKHFARMLYATGQPRMVPDHVPEDSRTSKRSSTMGAVPTIAGKPYLSEPLTIEDVFGSNCQVMRCELQHLSAFQPGDNVDSVLCDPKGHDLQVFKNEGSWATGTPWVYTKESPKKATHLQFLRAGPRKVCYWDPAKTKAAIVNCGGLCPGLNTVIREVVNTLYMYGCRDVFGIIGGYKGVMEPDKWLKLTPEYVEEVHLKGGSFLVSDRGNPPHIAMAKMFKEKGITHVYIIGGDGTQKGCMQIYEQMLNIGYRCSMCGVPKTIDNDLPLVDYTFGFHTAVSKAVEAIGTAYTEANCNANCMGLVKLMGRHAGFIAMNACISARHVDLCLIPEMTINMYAVKEYIADLMAKKGRCVVVIAEGLGDTLIKGGGKDAGGNKTLADIGPWFKKQVEAYMKQLKKPFTCKYIDPSYIVRAAPPDAFDSVYCSILAQGAVHGCMAGYTGFTIGRAANHYVMMPIDHVTSIKSRTVNLKGRWFSRLKYTTRQPKMMTPSRGDERKRVIAQLHDCCPNGKLDMEFIAKLFGVIGMNGDSATELVKYAPTTEDGTMSVEDFISWIDVVAK